MLTCSGKNLFLPLKFKLVPVKPHLAETCQPCWQESKLGSQMDWVVH